MSGLHTCVALRLASFTRAQRLAREVELSQRGWTPCTRRSAVGFFLVPTVYQRIGNRVIEPAEELDVSGGTIEPWLSVTALVILQIELHLRCCALRLLPNANGGSLVSCIYNWEDGEIDLTQLPFPDEITSIALSIERFFQSGCDWPWR